MSADLAAPRDYSPLGLVEWFESLPARVRADLRWSGPKLRAALERLRTEPLEPGLMGECALEWATANIQTSLVLLERIDEAPTLMAQFGRALGEVGDRISDAHPDSARLFGTATLLLGGTAASTATLLASPDFVAAMRGGGLLDALPFDRRLLAYFAATLCIFAADADVPLDEARVHRLGEAALANVLVLMTAARALFPEPNPDAPLEDFLVALAESELHFPGRAALDRVIVQRPPRSVPAVRRDQGSISSLRWSGPDAALVMFERAGATLELRADAATAVEAIRTGGVQLTVTWLDEGSAGRLLRVDANMALPAKAVDTSRLMSDWSELLARLAR